MTRSKNNIGQVAVMFISISITAYTLSRFALLVQSLLAIPYDWKLEAAIVIGQLVFQLPFIFNRQRNEIFEYYYNMLLVSLIGSILLLPIIAYNVFHPLSQEWNIIYFFTVVTILFFEHLRRVRKLELPKYLCITWALYRFIILFFIL